jgi:Undecaprenyl-phosphate glucose phosphotransferase
MTTTLARRTPQFVAHLSGRERMSLASDLLPPCDFIAFLFAAYLSSVVYSIAALTPPALPATPDLVWMYRSNMALLGASLAAFILYDQQFANLATRGSSLAIVRSFLFRFAVTAMLVTVVGNATDLLDALPRTWLAMWLATSLSFTALARWIAARHVRSLEFQSALTESIAVVGAGTIADSLDRYLRQSKARNVELVGIFDDAAADGVSLVSSSQTTSTWPVNSFDNLLELGRSGRLDWIVIALPESEEQRIHSIVQRLQALSVPIALCPQTVGSRLPCKAVDYVGTGLPVILLADRPIKRWNAILKSAEDICLSWLLALLLLPVFAVIALAIRLDSRGPIVFKQRRHTFNNTEFDIYKFRTMRWQPDSPPGALQQTVRNDQRITRVGRFLRETSLDELPQLFNVLRGEMSLVGPRPHAVNMRTEDRLGSEITDRYTHRHRVKPGMTGWSQVNGARGATDTIEQLQRRIDLDLYYVDHWSLALDFKILLMTFKVVFKRTNAY